ncbi:MAG: NAD-dependent epimerase/dehydratase [Verrucomicrobiales bacterium]|nr:NAD-dependent epimerase/dehydratase [Verrucomicrobiales bacterium]
MKILMTGASGFIGSAALSLAVSKGHDVTVLARPGSAAGYREKLERGGMSCEVIAAEHTGWAAAVQNRNFDSCLHLAWIAVPGQYLNSPENEQFAASTLAFADSLFKNGLPHFLGAGTCIEYAPGLTAPCREDITPCAPVSPYAIAKHRTHQSLAEMADRYSSALGWARVFYPYGAGEHPGRTATTFLKTLAAGQPLVLKTGASRKDFIEVRDVASALVHLLGCGAGGAFNIGTGTGTGIRELALITAGLVGADGSMVQDADPPAVDPYAFHVADTTRLSAAGWQPAIPLKTGLGHLLQALGQS